MNVSVGHAANGGCGIPATMRASTFSCAITAAPLLASPIVPDTLPPATVLPAGAMIALPPT